MKFPARKTPEKGDVKIKRRLLWFPAKFDDGHWHWLEWTLVTYEYRYVCVSGDMLWDTWDWRWIKIKTTLA